MQEHSHEKILIIDFGGQYSQVIARKIREHHVYSEIHPFNISVDKIKELSPKGIVLSGLYMDAYKNIPKCDKAIFDLGIPILAVSYGMHIMADILGGEFAKGNNHNKFNSLLKLEKESKLFKDIDGSFSVLLNSDDKTIKIPEFFDVIAHLDSGSIASIENSDKSIYAINFHPEVVGTENGDKIITNFLFDICKCNADWDMVSFIEQMVGEIKQTVGDKKVLCALSGGVDSSVAASLVHKAIGSQLTCVYVNHGFMRKGESEEVIKTFRDERQIKLIYVDASERFLGKVKGVTDPERKRKIIGEEFIRVFEEEAKKLGQIDYLVQGTVYPDVIESFTATGGVIKSHHNVGGLPENMQFALIEPLRELFKDEVRIIGKELGLPETIVTRQPFPGPGLAIRIIGELTKERLDVLRDADEIVTEEIRKAGLYTEIWQSFAILTPMRSVGMKDNERTYDHTVGLRIVNSEDGMSAEWIRLPYEILDNISKRITSEVKGVNRIVYDITSKPPSTIEWE